MTWDLCAWGNQYITTSNGTDWCQNASARLLGTSFWFPIWGSRRFRTRAGFKSDWARYASSQSYLKYRKSVWAEQEQLSYWERTLSTRSCSELVRSVQNLTVQSSSGTYLVYFTRRWRRPSSHFEAGFAACGYSTSLFCIARHTTQGNFRPQETKNIM